MATLHRSLAITVIVGAIGACGVTVAEERPESVLTAYYNGPPEIHLSTADKADLANGETLIRRIRVDDDERSLAVIRVNAPPSVIWSVLLDFEKYPQWVDGLKTSEIYAREDGDILVVFDYQQWLVGSVTYHIRHTYPGEATGWGTWTLDYRRSSDLKDTVGFWRTLPVVGDASSADVIYSTRIELGDWLSRWLGEWLMEDTLRAVTTGLKSRAESIFVATGK